MPPLGGYRGPLRYEIGRVCADGGEQCGDDGDDDLTDALEGFLCTFFHNRTPSPLPLRGGEWNDLPLAD